MPTCKLPDYITSCSTCTKGVPCMIYSGTCLPVSGGGACGIDPPSGCPFQCFPSAIDSTNWLFTFKSNPVPSDVGGIGPFNGVINYSLPNSITNMTMSGGVFQGSPKKITFSDPSFLDNKILQSVKFDGIDVTTPEYRPSIPDYVTQVTLTNCNLKNIPTLTWPTSLTFLSLQHNTINTLPEVGGASYNSTNNLVNLDLSYNSLSSFELVLTKLQVLDLSYNSFSSIPTSIYSMTSLTSLKFSGNPLTTAVTADQYNILSKLATLTMPIVTNCPSGSGLKSTPSTAVSICVVGATSSSSSTGLIIGIVVGVVVLIAIIGGFFWYRRRKAASEQAESNFTEFDPSYPLPGSRRRTEMENRGSTGTNPSKQRRTLTGRSRTGTNGAPNTGSAPVWDKDLLLPTRSNPDTKTRSSIALETALNPAIEVLDENEMIYTRTLGKGAKGVVWLASYAGDVVAVKKMANSITEKDREDSLSNLVAEANLLFTLRHPHIIQLIGVVTDLMHDVAVVLEYMDLGDLRDILIKKKPSPTFDWSNVKGTYALQVAQGLAYLHSKSPPLIHRDIKARNILVDSQKGAKICDFGESRLRSYQETMTSNVGTARWIAPEVILNDDYSERADIYSFGVLLSEIDTHNIPYADVNLDERIIVQRVAVGQLRPKFSDDCPEKLRRLANHCMQADPALRPDASKVVSSLTDLLESFVQH
ncbi:kinase [Thraustotheca clavata]|uniref:Kinase n=1 Tax=Thraustotheca clavata TaxID=74557 RepID=A0A1W0A3G7_9STRA|nr:kinase [Thraustotheca clavata]